MVDLLHITPERCASVGDHRDAMRKVVLNLLGYCQWHTCKYSTIIIYTDVLLGQW